jgi:hypothetical protein
MVVAIAAIVLVVSNILFVESASLRLVIVALVVLWIALTVAQFYYRSMMRRGWIQRDSTMAPPPAGTISGSTALSGRSTSSIRSTFSVNGSDLTPHPAS